MLQLSSGVVKTEFANVKFQLNSLAPGEEQENSCRCTVQAVLERLSTSRIHYVNRHLRISRQNDLSRRLLLDDTCHAWMHFCLKFVVRWLEGSICVQIKIIIINCIMVAFCFNRMICIEAMIWLFNDCLVSVGLILLTKDFRLAIFAAGWFPPTDRQPFVT